MILIYNIRIFYIISIFNVLTKGNEVKEKTESIGTIKLCDKVGQTQCFSNQTDQSTKSNYNLYLWTRNKKAYQIELSWELNEPIYEKFLKCYQQYYMKCNINIDSHSFSLVYVNILYVLLSQLSIYMRKCVFLIPFTLFSSWSTIYLSMFSGIIEVTNYRDSGVTGERTLPSTVKIKCK